MKKQIIVQFDIEGFHQYKDAPNEVEFLRNNHRHKFKIKAGFKITHNEREKELFMMRDLAINYINESYGIPAEFENMSVESIAEEIIEFFEPEDILWCEVWEEETGGARIDV